MPIFNYILWYSVIDYNITDSFLVAAYETTKSWRH